MSESVATDRQELIDRLEQVLPTFQHLAKYILVQIQGEDRLSLQQLRSLKAIAASDRGLPTSGLARELRIASPTVTRIVDVLVDRDLVARRDDPADRRRTRLTLQPAGYGLLERYERKLHDLLASRLDELAPDRQDRLWLALEDLRDVLATPDETPLPNSEIG